MTQLDHTDDVATACAAAQTAWPTLRRSSRDARAGWLQAAADALDANAADLIALAHEESHLAEARLTGELARTTAQLRLFATAIVEGGYLELTIDPANTAATPPHGDLRRMLVPLGPVAVFSASNFPFAFSVAGGDTASAWAAGCPVVVKAHSGHPRLSRATAQVLVSALAAAGAPAGMLSLVEGRSQGEQLVTDPRIKAVGFTGSLFGGRALMRLAESRPEPIPFYGELGSINPVVITAGALRERAAELTQGLVGSFTLGAGQFCTKPGLVLVPAGTTFAQDVADAAAAVSAQAMLTERMASGFADGVTSLSASADVEVLLAGTNTDALAQAPVVAQTSCAAIMADPELLLEERFGPLTLIASYADEAELHAVLDILGGSLTATLHAEPAEPVEALVDALSQRAGRVLFGGWPTGVAVTWSQTHGGPWPAATSALHTSVGVTAVRRFLRPVSFQDMPQHLLPAELRDAVEPPLPRRVAGTLLGS